MKALKIAGNDLDFSDYGLSLCDGLEQLAQEAKMSYGTVRGEWFLDEEAGMSLESIKTKPMNEVEFKNDAIVALEGTSQEIETESIEIKKDTITRKLNVEVKLKTVDGYILPITNMEVAE